MHLCEYAYVQVLGLFVANPVGKNSYTDSSLWIDHSSHL